MFDHLRAMALSPEDSRRLRLRRQIADARGALQSLHALGRARLGAGDRDEAECYFAEAEQLAESLGETLELATSALETFTQSRTRHDITHARVTLSRTALASGQERLAVQQGALARSAVQVMGYGLLCMLCLGGIGLAFGLVFGAAGGVILGSALSSRRKR